MNNYLIMEIRTYSVYGEDSQEAVRAVREFPHAVDGSHVELIDSDVVITETEEDDG